MLPIKIMSLVEISNQSLKHAMQLFLLALLCEWSTVMTRPRYGRGVQSMPENPFLKSYPPL
eukprot:TCALIF_12718-PA protein Name:"Protein of unknown function" AED:0.00 eAED:0.00 QI:94/1/1/1/0.33/0.25/4/645/60